MNKRLECNISGKVQMVMFRDFIQKKASGLKLAGYVENLPDGSVFFVAEGEEDALHELLAFVHDGPQFAQVEELKETWKEAQSEYFDFQIIF